MKVGVLGYLKMKISPVLYRRSVEARFARMEKCARLSVAMLDKLPVSRKSSGENSKLDNFENQYTPRRLLLVLTLLILVCGFLIKYLFLWFPNLHQQDVPLIVSVLLFAFLSPVLYSFFYTPMVRQYDKLRKAEGKMRELALIDVLTGLYNRRGFLTYADQLLKLSERTKRGLILIYADLDNMKMINDELGHDEGDRALVTVGEVLKMTFRSSDVVGRVGGDEFAILALEAKTESLDALRNRLSENLKKTKSILIRYTN